MLGRFSRSVSAFLFCLAAAGCATWRGAGPEVRALSPPLSVRGAESAASVPESVLDAFFSANGLELAPGELSGLLLPGVVQCRIDRGALQRAARERDRIVATVPADPETLWEALGRNLPLLLYLPDPPRAVFLAIPEVWDRQSGRIRLFDGTGVPRDLPADRFFALREPLGQAALCLASPRSLRRLPIPDRERTLLLAGHAFARGRLRRAEALYASLLDTATTDAETIAALDGQASVRVRRGKPESAIPLYRRALGLAPSDPRVNNNLAYAMLLAGTNPATALPFAETAVRLEPGNPLFLETAAALRIRLGEPETAAALLERAWTLARRHPPEVRIAIQDQLARAWLLAGRRDLARQVASQRLAANPSPPLPPDLAAAFPGLLPGP